MSTFGPILFIVAMLGGLALIVGGAFALHPGLGCVVLGFVVCAGAVIALDIAEGA